MTDASFHCRRLHQKDGQGDGSPRQIFNRRRRTREIPEPACANTFELGMAHAVRKREKGRIHVLSWYRLVGVAKTSSETHRRKSWAARKGVVWGREGFDDWCNSRETEVKFPEVQLWPNHIRESPLVERGIARTRRTCKRITQGQESE